MRRLKCKFLIFDAKSTCLSLLINYVFARTLPLRI